MDLTLLATLKDKLIHGKVFADVQCYFLDHFGEDPEFIKQGERHFDPFLEAVFTQVAAQLHGKTVPVTDVLLTRLAEHRLVHGTAILGNRLATVLFFEDARMGLVSVVWTLSPPETKYARFAGQPLPPRHGAPSVN